MRTGYRMCLLVSLGGCHEAGTAGRCSSFVAETSRDCVAARRFAARDTAGLTPDQDEIDRYVKRWRAVIDAEPILSGRAPQRYRAPEDHALIYVDNPVVKAAWKRGELVTGDAGFDSVIAELGVSAPPAKLLSDTEDRMFTIITPETFNEELLHAELSSFDAALDPPVQRSTDDGTWRWEEPGPQGSGTEDGTAVIDFKFGWGDCSAGCMGFHVVRAIAGPSGRAEVFDLGGDPLPAGMNLQPSTRPPQ